jgi:hypothetical protein
LYPNIRNAKSSYNVAKDRSKRALSEGGLGQSDHVLSDIFRDGQGADYYPSVNLGIQSQQWQHLHKTK